jgi:hypothetical protein
MAACDGGLHVLVLQSCHPGALGSVLLTVRGVLPAVAAPCAVCFDAGVAVAWVGTWHGSDLCWLFVSKCSLVPVCMLCFVACPFNNLGDMHLS